MALPDQSAMMLTQGEWRDLAFICQQFLDRGTYDAQKVYLCRRIIEAA